MDADLLSTLAAANDELERAHVFVPTKRKATDTIKVMVNGSRYPAPRYFWAPKRLSFSSPMVNDVNLGLCGGWRWGGRNTEQDDAGVWRVLRGLKPLARVTYVNRSLLKSRLDLARSHGFKTRGPTRGSVLYDGGNFWHGTITVAGVLKDLFDLDALVSDYDAADLGVELIDLSRFSGKRIEDLEKKLDPDAWSPWLVGLMFGYPVWSTISLYKGGVRR